MSYSSSEVKTGFFVLMTLFVLVALTFQVGKFQTGKVQTAKIEFSYVGGLKLDAPVHVAGYELGKVTAVEIIPERKIPVIVTVELKEYVRLFKGSKAWIDSVGFLGDKIVDIHPGTSTEPLAADAVIQGVDPVPTQKLILKLDKMTDQLDGLMQSLQPLMQRVDEITEDQREEIEKMIANFHEVSVNLRDMTNDLKYRPWRLLRKGK